MNVNSIIKKILPNYLTNLIRQCRRLYRLNNIQSDVVHTSYTSTSNILSELCEMYGTNKGFINIDLDKKPYNKHPHTYATYYHSIFNLSRENIKNVFECGIGTNNPNLISNMTANGIPGASLRVWKDYFYNAQIYGGDIDKKILFEEDRIKTFYVDQLDANSIKLMWQTIEVQNFDIIIDDGLHEPDANYNFFINSFHKLKKNGVFIIEDVSNNNLVYLQNKLKNYNIDIIAGFVKTQICGDDYLIIIKKL